MKANDEEQTMLADSAKKVFAEHCDKEIVNSAEAGQWPTQLWSTLSELGFLNATVPESAGGSGMHLATLLPTVRIAGRYAAPIPYGETMVAGWLLGRAGLAVPQAPLSFGPVDRNSTICLTKTATGWQLNGRLRNIPWGDSAERIALLCATDLGLMVASVNPNTAQKTAGTNQAGEPRTHLDFNTMSLANSEVKSAPKGISSNSLYLYGALLRSLQMAGALTTIRDLAVQYTSERIAFGKPLNRLQAVQHNLAIIAGQTAAANVAADMALDALTLNSSETNTAIAMAKIRTNMAVELAARLAHQALGAMGFTREHKLHQATRRLWSWRDEFGNDAYWSELVGQHIIDGGSEQLWPFITKAGQL